MESNQIETSPGNSGQAPASIWNIFLEPSRYFEGLNIKPRFIVPLLLMILFLFAGSMVMIGRMDMAEVYRNQIESSSAADRLTPEQIDMQVEMMAKYSTAMTIAGPILFFPLLALLVAGLMMLGIYVTGGEVKGGEESPGQEGGGRFARVFAVATGSLFFYTVVSVILTAAVILLASDPNSIDLNNPVFTNPAGLVDPKTSRALYTLLTRVDIVDWYTIFLMGLGLSKVVNKCSVGKGMALIGFWYVLFALLGTGLAVVF